MDAVLVQDIILRLGGAPVLGHAVKDLNGLRLKVENGLPTQSIEFVVGSLPTRTAKSELRNKIVPRSTLARRGATLTQEESERLERVARVISMAEAVWRGDEESAWMFLNQPNALLEGEAPIDVALFELGARQVEELLAKIEYGLPV